MAALIRTQPTYSIPAGTYTLSVWVKSNTGSDQNVRLGYTAGSNNTGSNILIPAAAGWTRIQSTFTAAAAITILYIANDSSNSAADILFWGAKLEAGNGSAYPSGVGDLNIIKSSSSMTWGPTGLTATGTVGNQYGHASFASPGLSMPNGVTVYAAVYQTASPSIGTIFASPSSPGQLYMTAGFGSSTYLRGSVGGQTLDSTLGTAKGAWHIVAVTCDGRRLKVYADDLEVADAVFSGTPISALRNMYICNLANFGPVGGTIGYCAGYSQPHAPAQIRQMMGYLRGVMARRGATVESGTSIVVYEGDSITAGLGLTTGQVYPCLTMGNLLPLQGRNFAVSSAVINGVSNSLQARASAVDGCLHPRLRRAVLSVLIGANDLNAAGSATTFLANLKAYCAERRTKGWRVLVHTVLARAASLGGAAAINETVRATANAEITNPANIGVYWDAVADFAADATMGAFSYTASATYCQDGIHPTAAGDALLAPINEVGVRTLLA